jgi:WD40 repeat protein
LRGNFAVNRDCMIRLWDLESGKELHCLKGHQSPVVCVAFHLLPKTGPGGMRVSEALRGQETNHEAAHG